MINKLRRYCSCSIFSANAFQPPSHRCICVGRGHAQLCVYHSKSTCGADHCSITVFSCVEMGI